MSKVVKVLAGAALMYFSAGTASVLMGGAFSGAGMITTGWAVTALSGAVTLVGASLAGSALAPEMPDMGGSDAYAGQKLQTKKDNVSAVPQVFGENRVGSNLVWQGTNNYNGGTTNNDYWAIQVISDGEIEDYLELYANEDTMTEISSTVFTTTYAHCRVFTAQTSATDLQDIWFAYNDTGSVTLGSTIGLPSVTIPAGIAFIAVHQLFDYTDNKHTQLDSITAKIQGKKINDIKDGAVADNVHYYPSGTYSSSSSNESNLFDSNTSTTGYRVAGDNLSLDTSNRIRFNSTETSPTPQTLLMSIEIYIKTDIGLIIDVQDDNSVSYGSVATGASAGFEGWVTLDNTGALDYFQQEELSDYWNIIFFGSGTGTDLEVEIREIRNAKWLEYSYSNNPASQVLNLLTKQLSIPPLSIDYDTFINASEKCDTYGYASNISFYQQVNIQSAIKDVLATCRGQIVFSQGKWKLKIDEKNATVVKALTSDDILNGSLNISMKGFQEIANKIDLKYINPIDNWLSAKVEKNDVDLISMDGQEITKTLDVKGITNTAQADKLAEITLNSMRYTEDEAGNRIKQTPLAISFATTIKNAELEVGDVISLDHELLGARVRKFVILSVETDQSGAIQVSAREYCETHYKDSSGVYII